MCGISQGIRRYISLMGALCIFFHDLDVESQRFTILPVGDTEYAIVRNLNFPELGGFKQDSTTVYVNPRH